MADMVKLTIAKHPRHLACPFLPYRNDPSSQQTYKLTSSRHPQLSIIHKSFQTTPRPSGISTASIHRVVSTLSIHHPSLVDHPRRSSNWSIAITTKESQSQLNSSKKPAWYARCSPCLQTTNNYRCALSIHVPTIATSSLNLHCTATTLAEDLSIIMVWMFVVQV